MGLISRVSSRTYRGGTMQRLARGIVQRSLATTARLNGAYPKNGGMTHDQRVKAWCDYFDHEECDYWYFLMLPVNVWEMTGSHLQKLCNLFSITVAATTATLLQSAR